MILHFEKQPLTREVARRLRAATRKATPLDGHQFIYDDLKELWATEDDAHLVLTHACDPVWQYWYRPPTGTIRLVSYHDRRAQAQAAAERQAVEATPAGQYVVAEQPGGRTIRVACQTNDPSILQSIFEKLGYQTRVEVVA